MEFISTLISPFNSVEDALPELVDDRQVRQKAHVLVAVGRPVWSNQNARDVVDPDRVRRKHGCPRGSNASCAINAVDLRRPAVAPHIQVSAIWAPLQGDVRWRHEVHRPWATLTDRIKSVAVGGRPAQDESSIRRRQRVRENAFRRDGSRQGPIVKPLNVDPRAPVELIATENDMPAVGQEIGLPDPLEWP
jgi:hypothetical protein